MSIALVLAAATAAPAAGWELLSDEDGIRVYRQHVPGSAIVAMRSEAEIAAPVGRSASVLLDTARLHEWMDGVSDARRLTTHSPLHFVEYSRLRVSRLVADREFVVEKKAEIDAAKRSFALRFRSVDHPKAPAAGNGRVRGRLDGVYRLDPSSDGRGSRLVVEVHADPGGAVPKWVVNLFQTHWQIDAVRGLRAQVERSDLREVPGVWTAPSGP